MIVDRTGKLVQWLLSLCPVECSGRLLDILAILAHATDRVDFDCFDPREEDVNNFSIALCHDKRLYFRWEHPFASNVTIR